MFSAFIRDEEGATLVEYILLAGLTAVVGGAIMGFVLFVASMVKFLLS